MSPKLPPPAPVSWSENRYSEAQMLAMYHQGRRDAFEEVMQWLRKHGWLLATGGIRALAENDPK